MGGLLCFRQIFFAGRPALRLWQPCLELRCFHPRKYDATKLALGVETTATHTVVSARVSGSFPGSPVELKFAFRLSNDRISSLEIPLWTPG